MFGRMYVENCITEFLTKKQASGSTRDFAFSQYCRNICNTDYFVPNSLSPASPRPGRIYPYSLRHLSRVET